MFLSKIWFFLVAIAAAAAITIALVMPRPAERATEVAERTRLQSACSVVGITMRSNARSRVQNAASVARGFGLGEVAAKAGRGEIVSGEDNSAGRAKLAELVEELERSDIPKPSFMFLVDAKGRTVARQGLEESSYGDVMAGYYAMDDALAGYLRDDTWIYGESLYRVAVTPVFTDGLVRSGALAIGYAFDNQLSERIGKDLDVNLSFYADGKAVASNHPIQVHDEIIKGFSALRELDNDESKSDCGRIEPIQVTAGGATYNALMARIPGEASEADAFYSVFIAQPSAIGFMGTLDAVKKDDLSFSNFPWIKLGILFLIIVAIGMGLMVWETDLPLRKLAADSVELAKSESKERLDEDAHRSKFGSIARSINIHIDKLNRETRAAKKEFDQLIGPPPEASGNIGLPGLSSPSKPAPPPPSESKFSDSVPGAAPPAKGGGDFGLGIAAPAPSTGGGLDLSAPAAPAKAGAKPPPPKPPPPKPPVPMAAASPPSQAETRIEEPPEALIEQSSESEETAYFREVYEDFVALKRRCGEPIDSLSFEKFSRKLTKNRDQLMEKHDCKSVKFQVYIKDGKAALKASPVK